MQRLYLDNADGYGQRDFTKFLHEVDQFMRDNKNEPALFDFTVVQVDGVTGWVVPQRGAYVCFEDDRWISRDLGVPSSVIFTGYVTDEPDLTFLGEKNGEEYWGYTIKCTSDDYLANLKQLPARTFVNKTHGYILKALLEEMFKDSPVPVFDIEGILDGGNESIYQVDTTKRWTEIAAEFGNIDGYVYRAIAHRIYYQPSSSTAPTSNDPKLSFVVDKLDPRFNPSNLDVKRVAANIINDLTVFGDYEPTTIVQEHFLSDGYAGEHPLAHAPFGEVEAILISDNFDSAIDTSTWQEEDIEQQNYIQPFEGSLNIIGGPGIPATTDTPATVYLRSRKGIEMTGFIETRDGEIAFPPNPSGVGLIGGLHTSDVPSEANMWCGWKILLDESDSAARRFLPVGPNGVENVGFPINIEHSYILRRNIHMLRRPIALPRRGGRDGALDGSVEYATESVSQGALIYWIIEDINADDPAAVIRSKSVVLAKWYPSVAPEYTLYAPIVPFTCHLVLNNVMVKRPQQVSVTVNGTPVMVGNYLDGARCSVQVNDKTAKLAWYAIPSASKISLAYRDAVIEDKPDAYYRLNEQSGASIYDATGNSHTASVRAAAGVGNSGGLTYGTVGALNGDPDTGFTFNGLDGWIYLASGLVLPATGATPGCGYEAWFKTTDLRASNPIVSASGSLLETSNGRIKLTDGTATILGQFVADGCWHHAGWRHADNAHSLYLDGVLMQTLPGTSRVASSGSLDIGHASNGAVFSGSIDEVAVYAAYPLPDARFKLHHTRGIQSMPEVATIPPAGSKVSVTYYRKDKSRARLQSLTSIATERQKYHDDGVRQHILMPEQISPKPRTSEECLLVARAYISDALEPRFEGSYTFDTLENNPTELIVWPRPGDVIPCSLTLTDGSIVEQNLTITNVTSSVLGVGAYRFEIEFGPVNRFEAIQRELYRKRKSSLDDPTINDVEIDVDETIDDLTRPRDPSGCQVETITTSTVTVRMTSDAVLPIEVVGYEVRTIDSGWGTPSTMPTIEDGPDVVAAFPTKIKSARFILQRDQRDRAFYIKPYDANGRYSDRAALVRVVYPMATVTPVSEVDGDINSARVRAIITIPHDQDLAGLIVRQGSAAGAIVYEGDGLTTKQSQKDVVVLAENGRITLDIPNTAAATSYTLSVCSYNLAGSLSTPYAKTIEKPGPAVTSAAPSTTNPDVWNWSGTADTWQITYQGADGTTQTISLPGSTTSWNFGGGGFGGNVSVQAWDDDFGTSAVGTGDNVGDTEVPTAPQVVTATASSSPFSYEGRMAVRVTWHEPLAHWRTIWRYQVWMNTSSTFVWGEGVVYDVAGDDLSFEIFRPSTTTYFKIRASNELGDGDWSDTVSATTGSTLDPLGPSGSYNYLTPFMNPNIQVYQYGAIIARFLYQLNDGAGRGLGGLTTAGDVNKNLPYGIYGLSVLGTAYALFLSGYHTSDNVLDGSTYCRTTYNQRDGGGRGYAGFNSSNNLQTGVQGSQGFQDTWYLVNACLGVWMALQEISGGNWRLYDNMADDMSIKAGVVRGANHNIDYVRANTWREGSGVGGWDRSR